MNCPSEKMALSFPYRGGSRNAPFFPFTHPDKGNLPFGEIRR